MSEETKKVFTRQKILAALKIAVVVLSRKNVRTAENTASLKRIATETVKIVQQVAPRVQSGKKSKRRFEDVYFRKLRERTQLLF